MKKGFKSCLIVVPVLVGLCIVGAAAMFFSKVCPPQGPWPMPPWCDGTQLVIPSFQDAQTTDEAAKIQTFLPSEVDIYGRDWYTKIEDLPLTGTIYAFGPSLEGGLDPLNWLKERGARVYMGISVWNEDAWKTPDQLPAELSTAYVPGFDHEVLYIQEVVFLNILDLDYQTWIKARMRELMDAGADGFTFDEVQGTSIAVAWGLGGPCDQYTLNGFRDYLVDTYSSAELQDKGVEDIATFDYCRYIDENGYRESFLQTDNLDSAPFKEDYFTYLQRATNDVIKEMIAFGKSYASEQGRSIAFGANLNPLDRFDSLDSYSLIDSFVYEHEWFPTWRNDIDLVSYAYGQPVSAEMKYAVSQGKATAAMYAINDSVKLTDGDISGGTLLINHHFAESYANQGYYMYFDLNNYLGLNFQAKREMMYPYYTFVRAYPNAFKDLHLQTDLAVVMPPHLDVLLSEPRTWAVSVSYALSEANLQHDFVDLEKITDYKVVVVSGYAWSDAQIQSLLDFMDQGGIVIAFDNRFATLDENREKVSRPQLAGLKTNGTHNYGEGKFIFFSEDMGTQLWRDRSPVEHEKLIAAVSQFITPDVAPDNVQVIPYVGSQRLVIHVLNYDFEDKDFVRKEGLLVEIHIPEDFSTAGLTMKWVSPDFEGEQVIPFTQEGNVLTFIIPSLYIWDVVILE